jgi:hypothetical protein
LRSASDEQGRGGQADESVCHWKSPDDDAASIKKAPSLWGSGLEGGLSMKGKKSARGFGQSAETVSAGVRPAGS